MKIIHCIARFLGIEEPRDMTGKQLFLLQHVKLHCLDMTEIADRFVKTSDSCLNLDAIYDIGTDISCRTVQPFIYVLSSRKFIQLTNVKRSLWLILGHACTIMKF
jgi:hypothetical protein